MGPVFAAMGVGFVGVALVILRGHRLLDQLAALYTLGLTLTYAVSRIPSETALPVEAIGLATKTVEVFLLAVLGTLILRP